MLSLRLQQLGRKGRQRDVLQVAAELLLVLVVVESLADKGLTSNFSGLAPSLDNDLGVDFLVHKLLGLAKQFSRQDGNSGRAITDLFILGARDVDEDLGSGVVNVDRLQDGSTIIGDSDLLARVFVTHRLQDLVHALGSEGGLDQVRDGNCANERLLKKLDVRFSG